VRVRHRCTATRVVAIGHHAGEIGMADVDFGIDYRDGDIVAPGEAMDFVQMELVDDILSGIANRVDIGGSAGRLLGESIFRNISDPHRKIGGLKRGDDFLHRAPIGDLQGVDGSPEHPDRIRGNDRQPKLLGNLLDLLL
jgi:hypothetical protein